MWNYEKRLQYPIHIKTPNAKIAQYIMSQYGGPDGEIGASMRYLSQRFAMPNRTAMGVLTDVGTEELAHLEMVSTIVHQLTRNLSMEEIEKSGFGSYYIDHAVGIWPQAAGGIPFNACEFQSKGDPITDLHEDLAAEIFRRSQTPSNSFVQERLFITNASAKLSARYRNSWMQRISMRLILALTIPAKPAARTPDKAKEGVPGVTK